MPAYGSIEHPEPRLSKTKFRMALSVMIGVLLLVAVAGAIRYVKFHERQAAVGTKLLHSQYDSHEHLALEQLTASLDRQLETLSQLESKALPSHGPEGKSESFLADIMGIQSPAMESHHPQLESSNSSSLSSLSSGLLVALLLLLVAMF
jgi:hypothetical protein